MKKMQTVEYLHSTKNRSKKLTNTKTLPCVRIRASITAEAAMAVPIFVLFLVLFLGLFRIEQVELQVNQALSYTASVLAMDGEQSLLDSFQARHLFVNQLKEQECQEQYIQDGFRGITLSLTASDNNVVQITADYHICLPVNLFGKSSVAVTQSAASRRWTGSQRGAEGDSRWVYITPFGTAYHRSSSCRYLDLSVWAAPKGQVQELRNKQGGRYYPCPGCRRTSDGMERSTVYVTDYGSLYHQSLDCKNLKRTVYRVPAKSVENRSPCQKCYGSE